MKRVFSLIIALVIVFVVADKSQGDEIYFTTSDFPSRIQRVEKDGSNLETILHFSNNSNAFSLELIGFNRVEVIWEKG